MSLKMTVRVIDTGFFKLDGGAMFGVVPKTLWQRLEEPDEDNLCTWAMRCLLVQTEHGRNILIDTGIGTKQSKKFFSHFKLHGQASLYSSLAMHGLTPYDITDVLLTHLHFDHVGGAVKHDVDGKPTLSFPNATYWCSDKQWEEATMPNPREQASFLLDNLLPLESSNQLKFIEAGPYDAQTRWFSNFNLLFAYGHTNGMILPYLMVDGKKVVYCADLIPSPSHIRIPYVMAYDMRPEQTLIEKAYFLERALAEEWILVFEHAKSVEAATVKRDQRGRIVIDKIDTLDAFLGQDDIFA